MLRRTGQPRRPVILAEEEARMLGDEHVGTERLRPALTGERASTAGQILVRPGAGLSVLRRRVMQLRPAAAAKQRHGSDRRGGPIPGGPGAAARRKSAAMPDEAADAERHRDGHPAQHQLAHP